MTLYLVALPNAQLASTRSRIRVATVRLAHTAQNCRGRTPFVRALMSDDALAALG
jgi:hypothetical protein